MTKEASEIISKSQEWAVGKEFRNRKAFVHKALVS